LLRIVLVEHCPTTSANACGRLVVYQKATVDRKERGAANSFLKKLDTSSVCKVSYTAIAEHMLTNI
jgi:hypothetical protein